MAPSGTELRLADCAGAGGGVTSSTARPASTRTEPLVARLEALVSEVPGFSPVDELLVLSTLVYATAHLPGDIVEVGSWRGRSALALGDAVRATHGRVHCVDLFPARDDWYRNPDGTWSFRVQLGGRAYGAYEQQTVWAGAFEARVAPQYDVQPDVYGEFRSRVAAHGLEDVVWAHRGTSATFIASVPQSFRCRLAFLDGDHGYEAVCGDIANLAPHLTPGGWLLFDDAFSTYDGVDRAIRTHVIDNPAFDICQQMTRKCFAARRADTSLV